MNERFTSGTVGDIVAGDFRAAGIFQQFGIDFCCGGRQSLAEACRKVQADPAEVVRALDALPALSSADDDPATWPADRLIDHIVTKHHTYVRSSLPLIDRYLAKLNEVHGARHPELSQVQRRFSDLRSELEQHMLKEEQVLFPYIRDLVDHAAQPSGVLMSPFGTVENPIRMMEEEHRDAADAIHDIRDLTSGFVPPADGCTTYGVCMSELEQFERDLFRHVHLENNVLFPKAVRLEADIAGAPLR